MPSTTTCSSSDGKNKLATRSDPQDGGDFGATTAAKYEQRAADFLTGPRGTGVLEKVRPNGDVVRYNATTEEFGVVRPNGTIRTYYKPDPAAHGNPTNLDYFNAQ
jgi:filamentous hemagglutinin